MMTSFKSSINNTLKKRIYIINLLSNQVSSLLCFELFTYIIPIKLAAPRKLSGH